MNSLDKNQIKIHQTVNLWGEGEVGVGSKVGAFCDIGGKVGRDCLVQCHVSIPPGVVIEDGCFIGPNVHFANDPRLDGNLKRTLVKKGAKIGMGALINGGLIIGEGAVIGMGALILKDVPDGETIVGLYK